MKYRIVKKYWKDDETACTSHRYIVEKLHTFLWWSWWSLYEYPCDMYSDGGLIYTHTEFKTMKEAEFFLKRLETPMPKDEIYYPNPQRDDTTT